MLILKKTRLLSMLLASLSLIQPVHAINTDILFSAFSSLMQSVGEKASEFTTSQKVMASGATLLFGIFALKKFFRKNRPNNQNGQKESREKLEDIVPLENSLQEQTMHAPRVINELGEGRKNTQQVIDIFNKQMADQSVVEQNNFLPKKTDEKLRLMSYNVHYFNDPADRPNAENIWEVIKKVNPDVLCLQEAASWVFANQLNESNPIIRKLGELGYNNFVGNNTIGQRVIRWVLWQKTWFGNIIASKIEPEATSSSKFENQERPMMENRGYSCMKLKVNNRDLVIYNTHLEVGKNRSTNHGDIRLKQIEELKKLAEAQGENVIIMGDFNDTRESSAVKALVENDSWRDSFTTLRWNHPQFTSMYGTEIDFMFLKSGFDLPVQGAYIYNSAASDHIPLIMDIGLDPDIIK